MRNTLTLTAIIVGIAAPLSVLAADTGEHLLNHLAQLQAASTPTLTEGEVRKVDKETGKITLRHGAIDNLGMPPMTMVFKAQDPAMLDQVKAGDKVKFAAEQVGGQYTVTRIERQP